MGVSSMKEKQAKSPGKCEALMDEQVVRFKRPPGDRLPDLPDHCRSDLSRMPPVSPLCAVAGFMPDLAGYRLPDHDP
jgi:hypothetical protein